MQNVAWPMMTDSRPLPRPIGSATVWNALASAMPVTMPGSAIGSTTSRDTALRPKNLYRPTANAIIAPSSGALPAAPRPVRTDVHSADRAPSLSQAEPHHLPVHAVGG